MSGGGVNGETEGKTREVYSHPAEHDETGRIVGGTRLVDHAATVGERCVTAVPTGQTTTCEQPLADAARVVGWLHDLGKATPWFQTSLEENGNPDGPTHHARIGGLAVYYTLRELGFGETTRLAGLHTVVKHHGSLAEAEGYVKRQFVASRHQNPWERGTTREAVEQAEVIDRDTRRVASRLFEEATDGRVTWDEFYDWIVGVEDGRELRSLATGGVETNPLDGETGGVYTETLSLWGVLSFADITAASGVGDDDERLYPEFDSDRRLTPERVRGYAAAQGSDNATGATANLNEVRTECQREVTERAAALADSDDSVFELTIPTGYGKTIAGMLAATHLRDPSGRVVYALPFTSVIDQTATVLQDDAFLDTDATGSLLTVHHHLAETVTTTDDTEESHSGASDGEPTDEEAGRAELLAEAWRSETVLTTFVQLFESLAAPNRSQSIKLPALDGSVVILDEPQALPLGWWPLIRALVGILTTEYDARVVSMTATQPSVLPDAEPLVPGDRLDEIERAAFGGEPPDRVTYEFHETALGTTSAETYDYADAAADAVDAARDGPTLCVCNTIDSAETLSATVSERVDNFDIGTAYANYLSGVGHDGRDDEDDQSPRARLVSEARAAADDGSLPLVHLSTRLRPVDRSLLLDVVSSLTDQSVPALVVSTQLIEAGVDVSFDRVFRDIAPLDSIVQAAGRCNRSFDGSGDEASPGSVTVWRLPAATEDGTPPSKAVYARATDRSELNTLEHTQDALTAVGVDSPTEVSERVIAREAVEEYHDRVGDRVDEVAVDDPLVEAVADGDFPKLARKRLVGTDLSFEVYVCRTRTERDLVDDLHEAYSRRDWDRVEELRTCLTPIRVSVPVYHPDSEPSEKLQDLPALDPRADEHGGVPTERFLDARDGSRHTEGFDERAGLQYENLGVDGRFL